MEKMHRLADRVILDQHHPAHALAVLAEHLKRQLAHRERDQPIRHAAGALQGDRVPGGERVVELGRARGLDAPHRGVASGHGQTAHHAGDQTAAAHRDHHGLHVGKIFGDLQAHRGLPGHDVGVVEGRDHREPFGGRERFGLVVAVGRRAAREHDLAAPLLDAGDLHRGRGFGHHDDGAHAESLRRERHRLPVVA